MKDAVAKFIIRGEHHAINDQWNGIHQAELEGYVVCKENNTLVSYKICGFDDDSKVLLDSKQLLKANDRLQVALKSYCDGYNPKTNNPLDTALVIFL